MSDTRIDSQTALVVPEDGDPSWDLAADHAFYPFDIDGDSGKTYRLAVGLRKYPARKLKEALRREETGYRPKQGGGDYLELRRTYAEFFPLFDECFVALHGVSNTNPAVQKAFIEKKPEIKTVAIRSGWAGLALWKESDTSVEGLDIDSFDDAPNSIKVAQRLWDPETQRDVLIQMTHRIRKPTQSQFMRGNSIQRQKIGRRGTLSPDINYDVIEALYNEGCVAIEGMLWHGAPCVESNREQWLSEVPLFHKSLVMLDLYQDTRLKN